MNTLNQFDDKWTPLQSKVFSRWISSQIDGYENIIIQDVTKDLSNGVILCNLAENLTKQQIYHKWDYQPKKTDDMVQNCDLALDLFQKDGIKIIDISGKDINFNNKKLIFNFLWTLIKHYSIEKSVSNDESSKINNKISETNSNKDQLSLDQTSKNQNQLLLSWATNRIKNYHNIDGLCPYELMLCALLDQYSPEKINYSILDPKNTKNNFNLATKVMKELKIPVYVYFEDLEANEGKIDEKTLLIQLSAIKLVLESKQKVEKNGFSESEYESFILLTSQPSITISDSYASSSSMFSYDDSQFLSNEVQANAADSLLISNNNKEINSSDDYGDSESNDSYYVDSKSTNINIDNSIINEDQRKEIEENNKRLSFLINCQEDKSKEENLIEKNNEIKIEPIKRCEKEKVKMNAEDAFLINNLSFSNFGVNASRNIREIFKKISNAKLNQKSFNMKTHHINLFKVRK